MIPAPSLNEVRKTLGEKPAALIGLLFAPPSTKVGKEMLIPRLAYLDERSGQFIHFFCAGYAGYGNEQEHGEIICTLRYEGGTVIPWRYSDRYFARFVTEVEGATSWKYSGESDLIIVGPEFKFSGDAPEITFSESLVLNIEAMLRDEAIYSAAELFESIMAYARHLEWSARLEAFSNREGAKLLGDTAATTILEFLPRPAKTIWKKGLHYRVQNLAR
jgi:hypothetical protein